MNIYERFLELLAHVINFLRIGLEIKRGNSSPEIIYSIGRNINILKSDHDYGSIFYCLDEQIRHSDVHVSLRIEKVNQKVYLTDARSGKEKIIRTYTFNELTKIIEAMEYEFFPVIYPTLILFDDMMLDRLLVSSKYKYLLLALGNC